jgi:peptidoglycan/xylan/chitin deacetylase (PgdA/CDA1 family)
MTVRSQLGDVRRKLLAGLCRRPVPLAASGPIITFSFDDFPRTALTAGAAILEDFGARATYYVAMSLMNSNNDLGQQFLPEDLHAVLDRGHELACHTFSHLSARQVSYDVYKDDVERGEQAIRQKTGALGLCNFAYPYGDVTLVAKNRLGQKFMSCRGTFGGLNGPDVDLNLLRANRLYGDLDCVDAARRLIVENAEKRHWLIFYSHDVANQPSPFGCTPKLLEKVCSIAATCGARFMTVAQVMEDLGQQYAPGTTTLAESGQLAPATHHDWKR